MLSLITPAPSRVNVRHEEQAAEAAGPAPAPEAAPAPAAADPYAQISELKTLLDSGALHPGRVRRPKTEDPGPMTDLREPVHRKDPMTFGPVQMLIVEFDSAALKGQILPELARLHQAVLRLIDLDVHKGS